MVSVLRKFLTVLSLTALASPGVASAEYAAGQVWQYKTRKGEENSRIVIAKVDDHPKFDHIYHLKVEGIKLKNPRGIQTELPHSPVSKKTLDASVTKLVETRENLPDISEGYAHWKEAFDSGQGGVFDIPVAQIIEYIENIANQSGQ